MKFTIASNFLAATIGIDKIPNGITSPMSLPKTALGGTFLSMFGGRGGSCGQPNDEDNKLRSRPSTTKGDRGTSGSNKRPTTNEKSSQVEDDALVGDELDDALVGDELECGVSNINVDEESENSEDDIHTEEDDIIDVTENVNQDNLEDELEYSEFDELLEESNDTDIYEEVIHDNIKSNSTHFAEGKFREAHDELRDTPSTDLNGMRKAVADLIKFVDVNEAKVNKGGVAASGLEKTFNNKKKEILTTMKDNLPPEMKHLVNMANRFSVDTLVVFYLHYAPPGWLPDKDDEHDFCTFIQCCIHTMKSKLLNFLYNENEHGPEQMEKWRYGGKTDLNHAKGMAVVDLIPFLLEKKSTMAEMEAQYTKYANKLSLDNYYELMAISYSFARMHLILARASHPKEKCQLHVASSAAAKHLLDLQSGISKYLQKYQYCTFTITIGPHPQIYLMGVCKSERMFPMGIRVIMNKHLVEVYSVFISFKEDFSSQLMSMFGSDFAEGVNLGIYSHLAKVMDALNLLDLVIYSAEDVVEDAKPSANDEVVVEDAKPSANDDNPAVLHYAGILASKGLNATDIEFFKIEMKGITIELFMKRIRKFRAGARLHGIAALMPSNKMYFQLPDDIKGMIQGVASILSKTENKVFKSLQRIKNAQEESGERLSLLSKIAAKYNANDGDVESIMPNIPDLAKLYKCTEERAIEIVEITAMAQEESSERLSLLSKIAAKYNANDGDVESIMPNILDLAKLYKCTKERAIEIVEITAMAQEESGERSRITSKLAKLYNRSDSVQDGLDAIRQDSRFKVLTQLYGTSERAEAAVVKLANQTNATFWKYYELLVKYKKEHNKDAMVVVDGKSILVVNQDHDDALGKWLLEMNGYANEYNNRSYYGVKAYMRMGSIEQLALEEIGVTFDPQLHHKAMNARIKKTYINRHTEHHGAKSVNTVVALRGDDSVIGDAHLDQQANQLALNKQRRQERRLEQQRQRQQQGGD